MKLDISLIKTILPNHSMLHTLTSEQLFIFLKFQVPATIVFINTSGTFSDNDIKLFGRYYANGVKLIDIETSTDLNTVPVQYDELLELINIEINNDFIPCIAVQDDILEKYESLIDILKNDKINLEIISNLVSISILENTKDIGNVYELIYEPTINGDSNKIYYFEINDTVLGFGENGPKLVTENLSLNSIDDILTIKI